MNLMKWLRSHEQFLAAHKAGDFVQADEVTDKLQKIADTADLNTKKTLIEMAIFSDKIFVNGTPVRTTKEKARDFITRIVEDNPALREYASNYSNDVQKMQNEKIGNSNVSFYQFLRETDKNKLAGYLSNEDTGVRKELKLDLYIERYNWIYPLYASMIESRYNEGMERRDLLSKGEIVLKHSDFKVLSENTRVKVTSFLNNPDLENVRQAGILALN